jgi:hypothetical protein
MEQSPSWGAYSHSASQDIPCIFKESEGSLPCSEEPATGPCPEPDESRFTECYSEPPFHLYITPETAQCRM